LFRLLATFKQLLGFAPVVTGDIAEVQLQRIQMGILEMEDVLFHLNSCVMMPEAPTGAGSDQGDQGATDAEDDRDGSQLTLTGIKALATVFRQLEAHPGQAILLAGHTDSSGDFEPNFQLAHQRSLNVRYLLEGERDLWAGVCVHRQKIEDHQQILAYFATSPDYGWDTDPGPIDGVFGDRTEGALRHFVNHYNDHLGLTIGDESDDGPGPLTPDHVEAVKSSRNHLWTDPLWRAVFDLYMEELARALGVPAAELPSVRERFLRWADERRRVVACGESFPIDSADQDNYRSQKNRRVEVLFFEDGQVPVLDCPLVMDRAHTPAECPIWHQAHFSAVYIDPVELEMVSYFLAIGYYDVILGDYMEVPDGLPLKAYGKDGAEIPCRVRYADGVYEVQVFKGDLENDTNCELQFGFATSNQYVYTADDDADPELRTVEPEIWATLEDAEKFKHHDLPPEWFSANYFARDIDEPETGDLYQAILERDGIKPFGDGEMSSDAPLVFLLDDIVLLDRANGTQVIQDADGFDTARPLADVSRVKILQVDPETAALKLFQTDDATASSARIPFPRNYISALAPLARIVLFREDFFTVARRRAVATPGWRAAGHAVGARVALRDDPDHHVQHEMEYSRSEFGYTGDYEAHYFHDLYRQGDHQTSYFINYLSINFIRDTRRSDRGGDASGNMPSAADVLNFVNDGVYNAMEHWNHKNYWLEEVRDDLEPPLRVRPFWFFEEKETFTVAEDDLPTPGYGVASPVGETAAQKRARDGAADDLRDRDDPIASKPCVRDARRAAYGGQARFLANICRDDRPAAKTGGSYCWAIRNDTTRPFTILKLARSTWERNTDGALGTGADHREYGKTWGKFTFAHELGHATGQSDEYIKRAGGLPAFEQFYECYTMERNGNAMMYSNGAPRLHYLWYAMHHLQERAAQAPLRDLLGSRQFKACFEHGTTSLAYTRNVRDVTIAPKLQDPDYVEPRYRISNIPRCEVYLSLHWVSEDEASFDRFHAAQDEVYQAVLCVRPKLWLEFVDGGGATWTRNQRNIRRAQLNQGLNALSGQYRLVNGTKDVRSIFVHVMGGFASADTAGWNYHLRYQKNDGVLNHGTELDNNNRVIDVGHAVAAADVVDALFNRTGGTMLAALGFLKTYADDELNDTFTLEEI